jgi:hypothetical protein
MNEDEESKEEYPVGEAVKDDADGTSLEGNIKVVHPESRKENSLIDGLLSGLDLEVLLSQVNRC